MINISLYNFASMHNYIDYTENYEGTALTMFRKMCASTNEV